MIRLLINQPESSRGASGETRFGGQPSVSGTDFTWPTCATCHGNMQFLGQLGMHPPGEDASLLLLFMCQNDPGLCEEWDASAGGNAVIPVGVDALRLVEPPKEGEVLRSAIHGAKVVEVDAGDYDAARETWSAGAGVRQRDVLGQLGGEPVWIQGEEVPTCDACGQDMSFVAQLEQGPDWETEMNFGGGGCAYVYRCRCSSSQAKMLWQC